MGDHPVLIPTSMGCLEGVVSEPEGVPLMAAIILPGGGGRFGPGRVWRRLARGLADAGVVTLRVDYPERGATGGGRARDRRHAAVQEAVEWFAGRTGDLRILLVGYCYGTRVILRRARLWDRVAAAALVNPYLRVTSPNSLPGGSGRMSRSLLARMGFRRHAPSAGLPNRLDPGLIELLHVAAQRFPVSILVGEHGNRLDDVRTAIASVESRGDTIDLELAPGTALIPGDSPEQLDELVDRVTEWARRSMMMAASDRPTA
jgi:dienelactone hydrolase